MSNLASKIDELTKKKDIAPETLTLLKMAAEAQKTGKMPPLPISMQPMPTITPTRP
jgi:hypothetical protein